MNASVSIAIAPAMHNAITTSVGRCHFPTTTEAPTSSANTAPITPVSARQARGTTHSRAMPAAAASIVCPDGAEFASGASTWMMNGRGRCSFSSEDAKHSTANTADCPSSHQRFRTIATITAPTANTALMIWTTRETVNTPTTGSSQFGSRSTRWLHTISS